MAKKAKGKAKTMTNDRAVTPAELRRTGEIRRNIDCLASERLIAAADRIEELEAALRWYAQESHYVIAMPDGQFGASVWPSNEDRGQRARAALKGDDK